MNKEGTVGGKDGVGTLPAEGSRLGGGVEEEWPSVKELKRLVGKYGMTWRWVWAMGSRKGQDNLSLVESLVSLLFD